MLTNIYWRSCIYLYQILSSIYVIAFIISSCNYITNNHFGKSWFTLRYNNSLCANLKIGFFSEMPCTLPFECYLQYLKLGVVNDKYHHHHQHHWFGMLLFEHCNRIKRWCTKWGCECLSLFDHLLHPSQQTMQNAVTWANSWV